MLGGDEEKDPDAAKKEEERQEALRQEEEERKAKYAKMEAEREAMRQGIRDKVGAGHRDDGTLDRAPHTSPPWTRPLSTYSLAWFLETDLCLVHSQAPRGGARGREQGRKVCTPPGAHVCHTGPPELGLTLWDIKSFLLSTVGLGPLLMAGSPRLSGPNGGFCRRKPPIWLLLELSPQTPSPGL